MWMKIDLRSHLPVYQQIKMGIKEAVLSGRVNENDEIPSIRELADTIRVNPNTVARSYRELESDGIILARQGVGYIVISKKDDIRDFMIEELKSELRNPILRFKKYNINKEKLIKVVEEIWETD